MTKVTYTNPVWPDYFADPFVLKHNGQYYAYGTGPTQADGRHFEVLRSENLVNWTSLGGALESVSGANSYWAPEVAEKNGKFFMYYSASASTDDETHRLRVAVSDRPEGPFVDSGNLLFPDEGFTIDAHPFRDPKDGKWYLFIAKDFFDDRAGTALAAAQLSDDMLSIVGPLHTILRASDDWQTYETNRSLYGRHFDRWHTLEGAFVIERDGLYYCMYSGGNWERGAYGVGCAVANSILGPYTELSNPSRPTVLTGVEGKVLGPGHNSVVMGPDNATLFVVYHAWDQERTGRRLCIDALVWTDTGPQCAGPSYEAQTLEC